MSFIFHLIHDTNQCPGHLCAHLPLPVSCHNPTSARPSRQSQQSLSRDTTWRSLAHQCHVTRHGAPLHTPLCDSLISFLSVSTHTPLTYASHTRISHAPIYAHTHTHAHSHTRKRTRTHALIRVNTTHTHTHKCITTTLAHTHAQMYDHYTCTHTQMCNHYTCTHTQMYNHYTCTHADRLLERSKVRHFLTHALHTCTQTHAHARVRVRV